MSSIMNDLHDPKLQDHYKLKLALQVIEDQDNTITKQNREISELLAQIKIIRENNTYVGDLLLRSLNALNNTKNFGRNL